MTAREAARRTLEKWRRGGEFSEAALASVLGRERLDPRDAALCARIVWSVLQNRDLLDFYIAAYSATPPAKLQPPVLDILRLSAAQLLFLDRVPVSAAVNEGVELCKSAGCPKAAGLVNAVLRRISEHREALPEIPGKGSPAYLAVRYSHPLWLAETVSAARGCDFAEALFAADNAPCPVYAQVNTLRAQTGALRAALEARGVDVRPGALPDELELRDAGSIAALPEFQKGLFYVQDTAARLAVQLSGAAPGTEVLDACAAPGGKSFAAALQMGDRGHILACDASPKKLPRIEDGARRLGLSCIETLAMDARKPYDRLYGRFDTVLADCPCSGLGVIRKKPEVRYRTPEEIAPLPDIQLDILLGCAPCVKPGGALLYSTCTILEQENDGVIRRFLEARGDFAAEETRAFWPQIDGTDGFFVCRMRRSI